MLNWIVWNKTVFDIESIYAQLNCLKLDCFDILLNCFDILLFVKIKL